MRAQLARAVLLSPAAAALAPLVVAMIASLPSIKSHEGPNLLGSLPLLALWSFLICYPIAFLHMVLVWPFYRWLSRRWQLHWWIAGGAGGLIGVLPVTMLLAAATLVRDHEDLPSVFLAALIFGGAGGAGGSSSGG